MILKSWWNPFLLAYLAFCRTSTAGVISLEAEPHTDDNGLEHHHHQYDPHVSVASSYMHFHGPVEGPEFEVKVPYVAHHTSEHNHLHDEGQDHETDRDSEEGHHEFHHGYTVDYVAHPKYEFSYGVEDHHTGDFHSQKEIRDGSSVSGEYSVKEPGGTVRIVTYRADKDGFHAVVHTSGKNDHSGATYHPEAAHHVEDHKDHHHHHHHEAEELQGHEEEALAVNEQIHGYASGFGIRRRFN